MNIGFLYPSVKYPPRANMAVYAYHVSKELSEIGNTLYSFAGYRNPYIQRISIFKFLTMVDIIYMRPYGQFMWDALTLIKFLRPSLPMVWQIECPANEGFISPWFLPSVEKRWKFYGKCIDGATCVSDLIYNHCKKYLGIRRCALIPNGSDANLFSPLKEEVGLYKETDSCFKVFWMGSGRHPWHGINTIISVANNLLRKDPTIKFILITKKDQLKNELPANVILIDEIEHAQIPKYVASTNVCLCLYDQEFYKKTFPLTGFFNSPLKLFDYMSSGKPVIATNLGQISTVIKNGANGFLTDNSIDDISSKIILLKRDSEKCANLGLAARQEIINYYNWQRVAQETKDFFLKIKSGTL